MSGAQKLLRAIADSRWLLPFIFLLSAAMRIVWITRAGGFLPLNSEMHQIAVSLARTGTISSAYRPDGIATTHVGPIAAAPAALIYHLFGVDSLPSELILAAIATAVLFGTMVVLDRAFALLDVGVLARRAAIALFLLVPVNINMETQDLRVRESGVAALILALLLLAVLRLDRRGTWQARDLLGLSALAALLFALSPSVAIPGYAAYGLWTLRNVNWKRWPVVGVMTFATLAIALAPWAYRNHVLLDRWVWSRGNVGLELAVGTYPAAVNPVDPAKTFTSRLAEIHPFQSDAAYARLRSMGGELAYADAMGNQTMAWAHANPASAAKIWIRHVGEFYIPPTWLWSVTSNRGLVDTFRSAWAGVVTVVAFVTIAALLWRRRWLYLYPAIIAATSALPFIIAQPRTRYRYAIAGLLMFAACAGIERLILGSRKRRGGQSVNTEYVTG